MQGPVPWGGAALPPSCFPLSPVARPILRPASCSDPQRQSLASCTPVQCTCCVEHAPAAARAATPASCEVPPPQDKPGWGPAVGRNCNKFCAANATWCAVFANGAWSEPWPGRSAGSSGTGCTAVFLSGAGRKAAPAVNSGYRVAGRGLGDVQVHDGWPAAVGFVLG